MSKLFLESLDKSRREVFDKLQAFEGIGVLGGGTAIALQIGHRRSFDFDIFTADPIAQAPLWRKIRTALGENCLKNLDTPDQLNLITPENIAVTFFHDDYPLEFSSIPTGIINLIDLRDLAANKARTIGQRGKWRDYVDMYFLLKNGGMSLMEVLEISQKRFGGSFSPRLFLQQLSYFGDIIDYKIDFIGNSVPEGTIKDYFVSQAKMLKFNQDVKQGIMD